METKIIVTPTPYIKSYSIGSVSFRIDSMTLNESVIIMVNLVDTEGKHIITEYLKLAGDDYNNWGADDFYITNYILTHFHLTLS